MKKRKEGIVNPTPIKRAEEKKEGAIATRKRAQGGAGDGKGTHRSDRREIKKKRTPLLRRLVVREESTGQPF